MPFSCLKSSPFSALYAIRHHPPDALAIRQTFAKGFTLSDMSCRKIKRSLCHGNVMHAMSQSSVGKPMLAHVEPLSLTAKNVLTRHPQIVNNDLRM
jgi:hypothetical protein